MKPLTLEMSDPLTLGMGHPVTQRIRRLSMRKTNIVTRSGTCALILGALGLTAPVFTATAASPVTEVVDIATTKAIGSLESGVIAARPNLQKSASFEVAEATPAAEPSSRVSLTAKAMRLRMKRETNQATIADINVARQAYVKGDKNAIDEINRLVADDTRKNRFQVTIDDQGEGQLAISKGSGGWPGFPATNTDWERRSMSGEMQTALQDIITRCGEAKTPTYYQMTFFGGDADLGQGLYEIGCVPGNETVRNKFTSLDLVEAYLASSDLPLATRQENFNWKMGFALIEDYVKNTPDATIAKDRAACIEIYNRLKAYDFFGKSLTGVDSLKSKCATSDYNWVRKRENLPLVQ